MEVSRLFNSITVCETKEDFDNIELSFPCVVVIWDNTEDIRDLWLDMVFWEKTI